MEQSRACCSCPGSAASKMRVDGLGAGEVTAPLELLWRKQGSVVVKRKAQVRHLESKCWFCRSSLCELSPRVSWDQVRCHMDST